MPPSSRFRRLVPKAVRKRVRLWLGRRAPMRDELGVVRREPGRLPSTLRGLVRDAADRAGPVREKEDRYRPDPSVLG